MHILTHHLESKMLPNMGKRKYPERNNPYYVDVLNTSRMFSSKKNPPYRPCREIVYTEDSVPVRKLYFSVSSAEVIIIMYSHIL